MPLIAAMPWITDITHSELPDGHLPQGPAGAATRYFGSIVAAASAQREGIWLEVAVQCRRRPGHRRCPGHIRLQRLDGANQINWLCTSCGDDGLITNWKGSRWDLSRRDMGSQPESPIVEFVVSDEELQELRKTYVLDPDSQRIVDGALIGTRGPLLRSTVDDLDELVGFVAAEANHTDSARRRRILDELCERMEETLSDHYRDEG